MGWLWKWDDYNPHVRWLQSSHPPPVVDPPPTWTARHRSHPSARRSKGPSPRFGSQREAFRIFWDGEIICKCCFFVNKYIYIVCIYIYMYTQTYYYNMNMYIWICMCVYPYIVYDCMTVNARFSWIGYIRAYQWGVSWIFCRVRLRVAHIPKMAGENSE